MNSKDVLRNEEKLSKLNIKKDLNDLKTTRYVQRELNLTQEDINKIAKKTPTLFLLREENIKTKVQFFYQEFKFNAEELKKIVKKFPEVLKLAEESIKAKVKFYYQILKISQVELKDMIKKLPELLGLSEENVKTKIQLYCQVLKIDKADFITMIKKDPTLLSYQEKSIKSKALQINSLNLPVTELVKNPRIFAVPENSLKLRYLIFRQVAPREQVLTRIQDLIVNQNKAYARLEYFESLKDQVKYENIINYLGYSENKFITRFGVTSEELMAKYVLTPEKIKGFESVLLPGEIQSLNCEERQCIDQSYMVNNGR